MDDLINQLSNVSNAPKIHHIKLNIHFCDDVLSGRKTFEIRKNDRGYKAGDAVVFHAYDGEEVYHKINEKIYQITYVLSGWKIKKGYVVFSIREVTNEIYKG